MTVERAVFIFAGLVILTGLALGYLVSPWWTLLSAFAALNMIQSAFTGICPAASIFKKFGLKPGCAFPGPTPAYPPTDDVRRPLEGPTP